MDFDFTSDQHAFRDSLHGYLMRQYSGPSPAAPRLDDEQHQKLWSGLAELGLMGALVPDAAGGLGLSLLDLALPLEELGRVTAPPLIIDTLIATDALVSVTDNDHLASILGRVAAGGVKIAIAFAEPDAAEGPEALTTRATGNGKGFRIQGQKFLVAEAHRADYILVACQSAESAPALTLVPVDQLRAHCRLHECLDVTAHYYEVALDVTVPVEQVFFGSGIDSLQTRLFDAGALAASLEATGIAGRMLDMTLDYLKQRMQFGKLIGSFQALKHRCADLAVALGSSRSAAYYATWALADRSPERMRSVSIAKSYCSATARQMCNEAIQLHGGMGFTWDQGMHLFLRRTKILEVVYGNASYHDGRIVDATTRDLQGAAVAEL